MSDTPLLLLLPVSDHPTTASGEGRAGFITSTPIKTDKENAGSAGGKRLFIRDEVGGVWGMRSSIEYRRKTFCIQVYKAIHMIRSYIS